MLIQGRVNLTSMLDRVGREIRASSVPCPALDARRRMNLSRRFVADRLLRTGIFIVFSSHASLLWRAPSRLRNPFAFRHSARNLPLIDSMNELSVAFPLCETRLPNEFRGDQRGGRRARQRISLAMRQEYQNAAHDKIENDAGILPENGLMYGNQAAVQRP